MTRATTPSSSRGAHDRRRTDEVADHLECPASRWNVHRLALNGTSAPIEHVKTHCPVLIATLVAIAEAAKYDREIDAE
jgi:hypothetical protein